MKLQIARSVVATLKRLLFLNSANKFSSFLLENVDLVYDFFHKDEKPKKEENKPSDYAFNIKTLTPVLKNNTPFVKG